MNRKLFAAISIIITSFLLLCFVSCEENNAIPVGSLNISIDNTTRAIEPNISLDVSKYEVSLLNGDGTPIVSKEIDKSHTSLSQNNIPVGSYTVKVDAKNSEGVIIGTGSASCVIEKDKTTDVSVIVRELSGKGRLSVTLTGGVDPSSSYTLTVYKPDDTEAGSVGFAAADTSLKAELELDNGFYYFVVTDGEGNASTPEAFRIVKGDIITAEAYIYESLGSFRITITNSIAPNPTLKLDVSDATIHEGEEFTVSATGMNGESLTYSWYVNGKAVEGSANTLTLTLDISGDYNVRCLAKDTASSIVWSCDKIITVHESSYRPTELTLSGEIETWVVGDVLIPNDMVVTLNADGSPLMNAQYGHGHRSFTLDGDTTLSCNLTGVEGYSYYFETDITEDGSTVVYIVIDKEIENPAYISFIFDYDYVFNKDRGEYRGFYLTPQGENYESEGSGIVSLTNDKTTRTIKVEPGIYYMNSYTGSNCPVWSRITPSGLNLGAGDTGEITVTIPYCRIKLKNYQDYSSFSRLINDQYGIDHVYIDTVGDEASFVLGDNDWGINTNFILWDNISDYIYKFEATVTMGETIEVEPVREDGIFVESEVVIPAGRAIIKTTSSVLFENSMWPVYKVEDAAGNSKGGTGYIDCRSTYCFNASTDMNISFADFLDAGYTYSVTVTPAEDAYGAYSEVVVNVDKEIENYATLRVTPNVNESLIAGKGTLITLQQDGDNQLLLLPYWATMEPYEVKVAPGSYRRVGFWSGYKDQNTGIRYAPRVDESFTCTSGKTTDVTLYLEEW